MTKHRVGVRIPQEIIERIIKFRAHGMSYNDIADVVGVGKTTAQKYGREVKQLPKNMWKTVEQILLDEKTYEVRKIAERKATDLDYYLDSFTPGDRFLGPLDKIALIDLQKLMKEPTGYNSPLSMGDWADKYLGGKASRFLVHSPHLWCKTQYEIFDWWETHKRLMVECFRALGKTMCADGIIAHEICENVDSNYFIMSETRWKAGLRVKHIGDVLLTNKKLIADYGFLPHIQKYEGHRQAWKSDQITVKRHFKQTDPSLMAFSSDSSNATGAHFAGGVFDDVWSFNLEKNSASNKEKWLGWYDGELEGCLEDAWELWLLTRKGVTDLYQEVEERQFHVVFKRPAVIKFPSKYEILYKKVGDQKVFDKPVVYSDDAIITDDGNKRFSIEFFLEKYTKMARDKWESEYQLNPIAAQGRFWKWSDLRFINGYNDIYKTMYKHPSHKIIGFLDLGFGMSARADYSALVIVAVWERKYYLLELFLKRGATEEDLVNMFAEACRTFPTLRTIYIEDDLQQSNKVLRLQRKVGFVMIQGFSSRQETARIKKEDSGKRVHLDGKALRLWWQLEDLISNNVAYVNKQMRNFKEFKDEFITFPSCKHYDVLDAWGNACSVLETKSNFFFILSG